MTAIIASQGAIAADRQITYDRQMTLEMTKLHRRPDPFKEKHFCIIAKVGATIEAQEMEDWYLGGCQPKDFPDACEAGELVVFDSSGVNQYCGSQTPLFFPHDSIFATGSGGYVALGALAFGATVEEAVEIAIEYDTQTGFGVDVFGLDDLKPKPKRKQ